MLRAENLFNFRNKPFYKIYKVFQNAHILLKDTDDNNFELRNYIHRDQFNK